MIKKVFPILAVCMFSSTLGIGIVAPLLPLYARDMGATAIWVGVIFAAYSISNAVVVPISGRFSDRYGRKVFLCIGLISTAIISLGYIWAGDISQLVLVRLIHGVAGAVTFPIALAYVGDLSPEGEEGKWMGYSSAAFWSGFSIGPLIGGGLTEQLGMTAAFSTMGGLNLLAFLIALRFLPEISRKKVTTHPHLSFKEMRASGVVKGLFSFQLVQAAGTAGIWTFLPIFATIHIDLSITLIGILLTTSALSVSLLTPVGGMLADRFNRRILVIIGSIIFIISLLVIPMMESFGQLLAVLLIQGISSAVSISAASALIVGEGRRFGMGSTIAVYTMAMHIGWAIGPILSGGIADLISVNSVFYFIAGVGLIGISLFAWFTK